MYKNFENYYLCKKIILLYFQHHYYDIVPFSPFHMPRLAIKQIFLRNFYENISISEKLSWYNLMGKFSCTMANSTAQQKLNQTPMEPFLETYYNSSNGYEIPLTCPSENLACESNMQTVVLGTDTCVETSMSLKDKYITDKQRYKAMRKWKYSKRGKTIIVCICTCMCKMKCLVFII